MNAAEIWNRQTFLAWNADLSTPGWKLAVAAVIAEYLIFLVPLALVAMWCWGGKIQRESALKICLVALVALGINQLVALGYPHPRPSEMGIGHTFIQHAADSSFPSDHGTVFAAMGLTLLFASAKSLTGWILLVLGAAVAWSRIYLGVHFPLDMLGAVAVVAVAYVGTSLLWNPRARQWTGQVERLYRFVLARPISLGWIRP
jgi:undecaprenyl-diphosphatase